jgi:hypothetical protein
MKILLFGGLIILFFCIADYQMQEVKKRSQTERLENLKKELETVRLHAYICSCPHEQKIYGLWFSIFCTFGPLHGCQFGRLRE